MEQVHVFVQDVCGLAGRGLCGLGQELRLCHGHVEVKGPVFQPLLLPVDLRDVLSGTRHLWKNSRERGEDEIAPPDTQDRKYTSPLPT